MLYVSREKGHICTHSANGMVIPPFGKCVGKCHIFVALVAGCPAHVKVTHISIHPFHQLPSHQVLCREAGNSRKQETE